MIGDLIKMSDDPGERRRAERRAKEERRRSKPPRKKGGGWFWKLFKFCCWAFLIALIVVPTGLYFYLKPFYEKAKVFNLSEIGKLEEPSTIYDRTGQEYGRIYVQDRRPVTIDEIPHHLIEALVAAEDSRFFAHSGVDYMGMTRAALRNLRAGGTKQGASTITQQLARQTFQILDRTMARKFTEIFLARRIEDPQDGGLPKQKILEHYLNLIYFGSGYYGVGAAAQGYFGKPVNELTIDEAALLCGLIKQPHVLSPFNNLERSIQERNYVLSRMVTEGMLSEDEAKKYKGVVPKLAEKQGDARMSFAYEEVRQRVIDQLGFEEAASGGFKIYTTLDGPLQKSLEESLLKRLAETERHPGFEHQTYAQYCAALARLPEDRSADPEAEALAPNYLQGAGLAIENETGAVLAVAGGRDYVHSKFNRAYNSRRAPGTAFSPFVYAAAFDSGQFPGSRLEDTPIDNGRVMIGAVTGILGDWGTEDPNSKWTKREITAREALTLGKNAATVRLGEVAGLVPIKTLARKAGIESPIKEIPATYLGASEVTLAELTKAYTIFPNRGSRPQDLFILRKIESADGSVIYESERRPRLKVHDSIACYQVHSCLEESLARGTGAKAKNYGLERFPAAGKTGTHYNYTDLWFVGYTSSVTCGVWVGFDRPKTIYDGAFGSDVAEPIWVDVMNVAAKRLPAERIAPPAEAKAVQLCSVTGLLATDSCYEGVRDIRTGEQKWVRTTYREFIRPGTQLPAACDLHSSNPQLFSQVGSPGPEQTEGVAAAPSPTPNTAEAEAAALAEPIIPKGTAVIGFDPYDSLRPIMRASLPGEEEPTVRKPALVRPTQMGEEASQIDLEAPGRLDLNDL